MNPLNPYASVFLLGEGIMRSVTLALPVDEVRLLLPYGLTLGPQDVTPPGTHPVIVLFNEMFQVHMSTPSLLPSLSYREHSLGIPHCYVAPQLAAGRALGPYYFQPRLHLDSVLATLGGVSFWGFPKRLATFAVDADSFSVRAHDGLLTALRFRSSGRARRTGDFPHFHAIQAMHDQPLVLMMPLGLGPFFVCANFEKLWSRGTIEPLETVTEVVQSYLPGLVPGRFPRADFSPSISEAALGSYVMRMPWRLSMPYAPGFEALMRQPG